MKHSRERERERESADLLQVIVITDPRGVLVVWGIYKTLFVLPSKALQFELNLIGSR